MVISSSDAQVLSTPFRFLFIAVAGWMNQETADH
jgi:hypothetical protein